MLADWVKRIPWLDRMDTHMAEVVQGSAVAMALKVLGLGLSLGFNVLLARSLAADGAGIYYLALAVITIAAMIGQVGLGNALLRFTAASAVQEEWTLVAGIHRKGIRIAALASGVVSIAILVSASWIAEVVYSEPALTSPLRLMALAILPWALLTLYAELLKGLKRIGEALLVNTIGIPLIGIPLMVLLSRSLGVLGAVLAYVLATTLVLLLGAILWRRATPQTRGIRGSFDTRLLLSTSLPLFWIALMNLLINQSAIILLGIWAESRDVGIYGVATRTAALTSFVLLAMVSIIAPKFAALYAQDDRQSLEKLARNTARLGVLLALVVVLPLILAPSWILSLFGSEFSEGATVLVILALGQFVNVATGPVGYLLLMTGHEKVQRNNVFLSAGLNILLGLLLIPQYGIAGAAMATAITLAFKNLNAVRLVRKHLSISVWSLKLGSRP